MTKKRLELLLGDITTIEAEAIVNAANNSLLGGGGVDGAIHTAAGPGLLEECRLLKGCETGSAKITGAHNLKAKYIIHAVGPVWYGGYKDETDQLAATYRASLTLANEKKVKSLAFPGISAGAYRFPKELAAMIAINETKRFLTKHSYPAKVIFVAYDEENYSIYSKFLNQ